MVCPRGFPVITYNKIKKLKKHLKREEKKKREEKSE
jgi:hypothetical protein